MSLLIENDNISLNDSEYLNSQVVTKENDGDNAKRIKINANNSYKKDCDSAVVNLNNRKHFDNHAEIQATDTQFFTNLSSWGLPDNILMKYKERGISNMFMWQVECLRNNKVLEQRGNLVYSAPTSAGKTLVAEILALKTLIEKQKKVIIILPFVSVVREKMFYFQDILSSSGIRVEGFMGSHRPPGGFKAVQMAICTIEKANSIINKLLEENTLGDIGAVIIDEMHLLGDPSRGYLLELLLTKLRYMAARSKNVIQLIGMSATLPNLDLLAKWLSAELFTTNFRPIPLKEYCLISSDIFDSKFKLNRHLETIPDLTEDTDNILQLCLETISKSCSILIFCPTKNWCENLAQQISVAFWKLGKTKSKFGECLREQLNGNAISEILEQLKRCPVGLDSILKKTASFGVSFHHAGLTMDERDIIEGAFRNGTLRVLVATSTLSSGVNLPAQRVIVRTPMFHGKPIDSLIYRQMIGRAGRMGKDTSGESILVCQKNDRRIAEELLTAKLHPIESCLEGAGKLKRAILEVIASGVATTPDDVKLFTNCTLLATSMDGNIGINNPIKQSVDFLVKNEFIRLQTNETNELKYVATNLAKACLSSSLPPEDGLALFEEIEKARQCFVLDSDLHLLYLVTPYSVCSQWSNLDWMLYLDIWEKLSPSMKRVADLVGVQESFIFNATRGRINTSTSKQFHRLQIHRRFYTALALQDLVNEIPLNKVANKFQCNRGMLQSLQQSASMFAGMVTSFCSQLGWKNIEILVSQFQDRLQFGIQHELLELMKLPNLNGQRARSLYNAGIESLADLASLDICKLENILLSSVPFESEKEREGETAYDVEQKRKIRGIFITGKQGLTARDAAEMLIKDARQYLQLEIGAAVLKWDSLNPDCTENNSNKYSSTSSEFENNEKIPEENYTKNVNDIRNKKSTNLKIGAKYISELNTNNLISDNCSTSSITKHSIQESLDHMNKSNLKNVKDDNTDILNNKTNLTNKLNSNSFKCLTKSEFKDIANKVNNRSIKPLNQSTDICNNITINEGIEHNFLDSSSSMSSEYKSSSEKTNSLSSINKDNILHSNILKDDSLNIDENNFELEIETKIFEGNFSNVSSTNDNSDFLNNSEKFSDLDIINNKNIEQDQILENNSINIEENNFEFKIETKIVEYNFSNTSTNNNSEVPINLEEFNNLGIICNKNVKPDNIFKNNSVNAEDSNFELEIETKIFENNFSKISSNDDSDLDLSNSEQFNSLDIISNVNVKPAENMNDKYNKNILNETESFSEIFEKDYSMNSNSEKSINNTEENIKPLHKIIDNLLDMDINTSTVSDKDEIFSISSDHNSILDSLLDISKSSQRSDSFTLNISESESNEQGNEEKPDECNWTPLEIPSFVVNISHDSKSKREPLNEINLDFSSNSTSDLSNTSLFGESICLDSKLNNALDNNSINSKKGEELIMDDTSFFKNISKAFNDTESFSEEMFASENDQNENAVTEENILDVVETSQTDITECSFHSVYNSIRKNKKKSKQTSRKRNHDEISQIDQNLINSDNTPNKKQKLENISKCTYSKHDNIELNTNIIKQINVESIDLTKIEIVDVCANKELFETFRKELTTKTDISFSCACERIIVERPRIGQNIVQPSVSMQKINIEENQITDEERLITGIAVSFGENAVYFISFTNEKIINNKNKIKFLQQLLTRKNLTLRIFDYKEHAKVLYRSCKIAINAYAEDPKMADWLLEPEGKEKNLSSMALKYAPEAVGIAQLAGNCKGVGSVALDLSSAILSRIRASVEALVTWHVIESQKEALAAQDINLLNTFNIEMKNLSCLAEMEITGLKVDKEKLNALITSIQEEIALLQQQAFSFAGRRFSFTSSKDVAKVLGLYKGKRVSTNKQALEQCTNPIANIVSQWRKLNCTLTKMIYPIIRSLKNDRIHGCSVTHTSTGRISMHEPNLQNVPRNFEIIKLDKSVIALSARASFVPSHGKIFISADYCQLELRLLAHLSQDLFLCTIMRKEGDVFKSIAAKLNKISERQVTDELRQRAKQLCYGVIYGMGAKALSEQLNSTEEDAVEFTNSFKNTYPKVKDYIQYTIDQCRENGYVTTLAGRRRYLPQINNENSAIKNQTERQAVNTTIQGSAADLAKNAMVLINEHLQNFYSTNFILNEVKTSLVLHLHDELLYEVPFSDLKHIAKIVKNSMENSVNLSIPFPVKVKSGQSWGELKEFSI